MQNGYWKDIMLSCLSLTLSPPFNFDICPRIAPIVQSSVKHLRIKLVCLMFCYLLYGKANIEDEYCSQMEASGNGTKEDDTKLISILNSIVG